MSEARNSKMADLAEFLESQSLSKGRKGATKPVTVRLDYVTFGYLKALSDQYDISATKLAKMLLDTGISELADRYPDLVPHGFEFAGHDENGRMVLEPTFETIQELHEDEEASTEPPY